MAAVARLHFDSIFVCVFAGLGAILFGLHFRGNRAIAQIVRAFNRLLHAVRFPALGIV
jgi:hypothetical protein